MCGDSSERHRSRKGQSKNGGLEGNVLVEVNSTVRKLAEGSLLLHLGRSLGILHREEILAMGVRHRYRYVVWRGMFGGSEPTRVEKVD